jgi:hypothetical protein
VRRTAGTLMNSQSSRSHTVFTVTLAQAHAGLRSQMHFADLAGSERAKQTKHEGLRLREASHINRSTLTHIYTYMRVCVCG